jgi:LmbE family N-acetylglucosaminyl deacetylase
VRVLVLSVHPDDEALGCAGTILRHRAQGDELHWLIVTQAHTPRWSQEVIDRKADEVRQAAALYGMQQVYKLGQPTTQLDQVPQGELIGQIAATVAKVRPEVIYTIHDGDVHTDHRVTFSALTSAVKPFNMQKLGVKRILSFETLSSTDAAPQLPNRLFIPNVYHDITPYIDQKVAAMAIFDSEQQTPWQPRGESAIRALARYRGATMAVESAEAFMLIRECQW